jgi:hypothetical protein
MMYRCIDCIDCIDDVQMYRITLKSHSIHREIEREREKMSEDDRFEQRRDDDPSSGDDVVEEEVYSSYVMREDVPSLKSIVRIFATFGIERSNDNNNTVCKYDGGSF